MIFLSAFVSLIGASSIGSNYIDLIVYDKGLNESGREYVSAENCLSRPCTITENGAIQFSGKASENFRISLGSLHKGSYRSIHLFQESTTFEQKVSERIFVRKPNRKIVDLPQLIQTGRTNTIFMYGLLLQYEFDEGDLVTVQLIPRDSKAESKEYYFRYHQSETRFDIDIAFVQPINYFAPNPRDIIQAAYSTAALSFSFAKSMDPDVEYNLFSKIMRAVRFNIFTGLLVRTDVADYNNDKISKDYFDGFVGVGLTAFGFLAAGYGVNMVQSPHAGFPFVGIELNHLAEFLRSLRQDTHTRWQNYLDLESTKIKNP